MVAKTAKKSKAKPKTVAKKPSTAGAAYCVSCKKNIQISGGKACKMKKGRKMMKGKCPKCGTKVCRFLPKDKK